MPLLLVVICFTLTDVAHPLSVQPSADELFEQGRYAEAVLEYKRMLYQRPEDRERQQAHYRLGQCYYELGDFPKARWAWKRLLNEGSEESLREQTKLMIGRAYLRSGEDAEASAVFHQLAVQSTIPSVQQEARYLKGWSAAHQYDWYTAVAEFRRAANVAEGEQEMADLSTRLADIVLAEGTRGRRSVPTARALSLLLPGAGHIYSGQTMRGGLAVVVTGGLGYLLVDSIQQVRTVDVIGLSLIGASLYRYNVNHAGKVAEEHNSDRARELLGELRRQSHSSSPIP